MLKTIIIDKNAQSAELLENNIKGIQNIEFLCKYSSVFDVEDVLNIDLILFDVALKEFDAIFSKIREFKQKNKNLKFIALSYEINSELVTKVLNEGVSEFLLKPIIPALLETAIKKIETPTLKKASTISVFSNKGGVGKTSLAINLAYEIYRETKEKVCILDLSFNSEDVAAFLDIEQRFDIDYIMSNIENSNKELLLSLMCKYQDTELYVLEAQEDISPELKYTPQKISKIINSLKNIFDYIVIDTSSLINELNISILNNSDLILLIGLSNMPSIRNCQKCYELFDNIGYKDDKIKLIVNRFIENSELTINDIKNTLDQNVFYKIPNNYLTLIDAINIGATVEETNPQSNIAKAYKDLTHEILNIDFISIKEKEKTNYNHGIFNLLRRMGE